MGSTISAGVRLKADILRICNNEPGYLYDDNLRFWQDKNNVLANIAHTLIMKSSHPLLTAVRINYVWRNKPEMMADTYPKRISVRKYPYRERDIFGYDVQMEVCARLWVLMSPKDRVKLIDHGLNHIDVMIKEDGSPDTDSVGRVKVKIILPDVRIVAFKKDLDSYGLSQDEIEAAKIIRDTYNRLQGDKSDGEKGL